MQMKTGRHVVSRCAGQLLVGLLCGIAASACDFRPSAPESRAEYFVEKLILKPQAVDELRNIARLAEGESPDSLASDPPARNALTYLRARQRFGATFGFHIAGTRRPAANIRVVSVAVSEDAPALKDGAVILFQVELQNQDDIWLVTRLRSD